MSHSAHCHSAAGGSAAGKNMRTDAPEGGNRRECTFIRGKLLHKDEEQRLHTQPAAMAAAAAAPHEHQATFILVCMLFSLSCSTGMDTSNAGAYAPGDVLIGGIFAIHNDVDRSSTSFAPHLQPCIRFVENRLVKALAMINAIEVANKSPPLTDANITLGYWLVDSCSDVSTALKAMATFIQRADCHHNGSSACQQPVMAVIGAAHSETSIAVARQLTLPMIPQISYSSTAVILSDKRRFPSFLRTIPNDEHQTAAMASLLSSYGWNWVGVVISDGDYGRSALDHFSSQAPEMGICVAFKLVLPPSVSSKDLSSTMKKAAETILTNDKVQVIVSFAKASLMKVLYQELHDQAVRERLALHTIRRVWVASDSWSASSSVMGNLSLEDIGHVVGFAFKNENLTSFHEYLNKLETAADNYMENNSFLKEFYSKLSSSNMYSGIDPPSILRKHISADRVFSIEMAVSAIAQAVSSVCKRRDCKTAGRVQPWEVLQALWMEEFTLRGKNYRFDSRGDINMGYNVMMWRSDKGSIHVSDVVAEYHPSNNSFTHTNHHTVTNFKELRHIVSKCSESCLPGEFKKTAEGQHTCCYECINCTENYYSNSTDMSQCLSCNMSTEWSPEGSSECNPKRLLFFSWHDGFAVVLLTFSALGIVLVLLVSVLFLRWRDTPVVKAAGGPLSQVILFSLVVSYISAVLFVGKPNDLQCKARQVLYGISFTLCVSCILVKTLQILLAFQFNPKLQDLLKKLYQPYVIVSVCVALQVTTCICWLMLKSPSFVITRKPTTLLEACHEGSYLAFGVMLGYIAVLAFVCFICAFKGRKLPQQYNEGRFITFSMLLYLISWLLFIPVYVTTTGVYLPAVEMVVILISNYGILSCHFFPKCYIILFKKEQNTVSAFRKDLYEYSSRPTEWKVPQRSSTPSLSAPPSCPLPTVCVLVPKGSRKRHHCLSRSISL